MLDDDEHSAGVAMLSSDFDIKLRCRTKLVVDDCGRMNFGLGKMGGGGLDGDSL